MRRPPSRYLPHSYALMAVGAALTVFIVVQLVWLSHIVTWRLTLPRVLSDSLLAAGGTRRTSTPPVRSVSPHLPSVGEDTPGSEEDWVWRRSGSRSAPRSVVWPVSIPPGPRRSWRPRSAGPAVG